MAQYEVSVLFPQPEGYFPMAQIPVAPRPQSDEFVRIADAAYEVVTLSALTRSEILAVLGNIRERVLALPVYKVS